MADAHPKVALNDINAAAERLKNWGRWGADDEIGTLNNITPQDIVNAARLILIIEQLATAALEMRKQSQLATVIAQRALMSIAVNAKRRG